MSGEVKLCQDFTKRSRRLNREFSESQTRPPRHTLEATRIFSETFAMRCESALHKSSAIWLNYRPEIRAGSSTQLKLWSDFIHVGTNANPSLCDRPTKTAITTGNQIR